MCTHTHTHTHTHQLSLIPVLKNAVSSARSFMVNNDFHPAIELLGEAIEVGAGFCAFVISAVAFHPPSLPLLSPPLSSPLHSLPSFPLLPSSSKSPSPPSPFLPLLPPLLSSFLPSPPSLPLPLLSQISPWDVGLREMRAECYEAVGMYQSAISDIK